MTARYALVAFLLFPFALGAQTPCVDGQAGEFACEGIDMLAHLPKSEITDEPNLRGNDMWGWTDPETNTEYALIGLEDRTVFIDLSVPTDPQVIGTLLSECAGPRSWRDMKVYADHAFIVADACNHGVQVFDLTQLRDATPPETFTADAHYNLITNSHNIAINEEAALAFPVGSNQCSGGLEILDISDPLNPSHTGCFADTETSYVHDTQCIRYDGPDQDYVDEDICFNATADQFGGSSENYVTIVNVSDPSNPQLIERVFYAPGASYGHQGWLSEDRRFYFLDDELTESVGGTRTYVFDFEDLDNPEFIYMNQGTTDAGAHNLYVKGDYMYQSNYEAGLRIWNVETPGNEASLEEVAYFDTYPPSDNPDSYDGTWSNYPFFDSGIVVVNDRQYGVFILQPTALPSGNNPNPTPPEALIVTLSGSNPVDEQTAISINPPTDQEVTVELLDAKGRVLQTVGSPFARAGRQTTVSVDVQGLPAGTYFLRVQGEQEVVTKRVAVVR